MILLERKKENKHLLLETIVRRLPRNVESYAYFEEMLRRTNAGLAGEQRVDREWQELELSCTYYLFHNLQCMNNQGYTHQIDSLLLCPYFVLIVEVKNITGHVNLSDELHQFTRTLTEGKVDGFRNPFDQLARHKRFLEKFLEQQEVQLPIEYAVISANPNMVMANSLVTHPIFHVSGLANKLNRLFKKYVKYFLDDQALKSLSYQLLSEHQPMKWDSDIRHLPLKKGVLCPKCDFKSTMKYKKGKWICSTCLMTDESAIYWTLHDYQLLYANKITNSEFRTYFGISSASAAYKKLQLLKLKEVGQRRHRKYLISENILERLIEM